MDNSNKPFLNRALPILSRCSRTGFGALGVHSPCLNAAAPLGALAASGDPGQRAGNIRAACPCCLFAGEILSEGQKRAQKEGARKTEEWRPVRTVLSCSLSSTSSAQHLELFNVVSFLAVQHTDLRGRTHFVRKTRSRLFEKRKTCRLHQSWPPLC